MPVDLDPKAKPPDQLRALYKRYQKLSPEALDRQLDLIETGLFARNVVYFDHERNEHEDQIPTVLNCFMRYKKDRSEHRLDCLRSMVIPGLSLYPRLIPQDVQVKLLSRLFHDELAKPGHNTNLHLHYNVNYPDNQSSFFAVPNPDNFNFPPKDPSIHKPLDLNQVLDRKLRWITLGGQYNWTAKEYPDRPPETFPPDMASLIHGLFPSMVAEAAIVNLYSAGDTLSLHRDVAEESAADLVSISLGCDAVFIVGLEGANGEPTKGIAIKLRSGDALCMSGEARYAWHGVPLIVPDSCPQWLQAWPYSSEEMWKEGGTQVNGRWMGWMAEKRVNLNVRQMFDREDAEKKDKS